MSRCTVGCRDIRKYVRMHTTEIESGIPRIIDFVPRVQFAAGLH